MSSSFLASLLLPLTAAVVVAIFLVLWHARGSARDSRVAVIAGAVLAAWAILTTVLARRGVFELPDPNAVPPVGIAFALALLGLGASVLASPSLRRLLTNQRHLILLNLWRLVGAVFLMLMATGQVPALWAVPAGMGDVIVGAMAPWIARTLETPQGRRRAIAFNLFGMADLIVAVGLGITTSPGPAHVFDTTPTSELLTRFPLAIVPAFLVPIAFALHVISISQLVGGTWRARRP